jgi:CDGSH-type Zn-finger protein
MRITVTENGPYKVEGIGDAELVAPDGTTVDTGGRDTVFLCRCGGSTNKPFCDGTHTKAGFDGAMAAVRAAES